MPATRSTRPAASELGCELLELANVGPKVCRRFVSIGITSVEQLRGRDAMDLYEQMQEVAGHSEDPCLLDTVMSAIDQANGNPPRPWWSYTEERKRLLADG
jgi:Pathogenicity locus